MHKIDHVTSVQSRGQYTCICVELDLEKPLESKIDHEVIAGVGVNSRD